MAINNYFSGTPISIDFANVKQIDSKPAASGFDDGNIIFDRTEQKFYQAVSGSWILLDFIGDDFTVNKLAFNTAATETLATGELAWNTDDETVDMHVGDNVTIQLGQEMVYHVVNQTGSQIDNGTVVMADGALGASGKIKVVPAIADGSVPAKHIMGVATEDIPNGALGYVTAFGKVRGFDTSSYSSGTVLYASATSSGSFTDVAPSLPNQKVTVAITLDQKSNGNIFVRPTYDDRRKSVSSISDLENVNTTENDVVYLDAGGRSGWFKWNGNDNLSSEVSDDTGQGIYVAPNGENGSNGAWVREFSGPANVKWFGATGDGTTNDSTALENAFLFAGNNDKYKHLYAPAGKYICENVRFKGRVTIEGENLRNTIFELPDSSSADAVFRSYAWENENASSDFPVYFRNFQVDGNRSNQSSGSEIHGIIVYNFWPRFEGLNIANTTGHGIWCTDQTKLGVQSASNFVRPFFGNLRFSNIGKSCIRSGTPGQSTYTDGKVEFCILNSCDENAIHVASMGGWTIVNNQWSAVQGNGIFGDSTNQTVIVGNLIDGFGQQQSGSVPASVYGIQLDRPNGSGVIVIGNNVIKSRDTVSNSDYYGIGIGVNSVSGNEANVYIGGNVIDMAAGTGTGTSYGIEYTEPSQLRGIVAFNHMSSTTDQMESGTFSTLSGNVLRFMNGDTASGKVYTGPQEWKSPGSWEDFSSGVNWNVFYGTDTAGSGTTDKAVGIKFGATGVTGTKYAGIAGYATNTFANNMQLRMYSNDTLAAIVASDNLWVQNKLGVGNSVAATTLGSVTKKIEIFNESGNSLGFLPVYDSIT